MDNQTPQASEDKIKEAQQLLALAGFTEPSNHLIAESIILSKSDSAITDLILTLKEMISEKEAAYQEYKVKIAEIAKEMAAGMQPATPPVNTYTPPTTGEMPSTSPTEFNPGLPGDTQPTQI